MKHTYTPPTIFKLNHSDCPPASRVPMTRTIQFRLPEWQSEIIQTYFRRYTTVHAVTFSEFIRRCVLQSIPDYCFRHEV